MPLAVLYAVMSSTSSPAGASAAASKPRRRTGFWRYALPVREFIFGFDLYVRLEVSRRFLSTHRKHGLPKCHYRATRRRSSQPSSRRSSLCWFPSRSSSCLSRLSSTRLTCGSSRRSQSRVRGWQRARMAWRMLLRQIAKTPCMHTRHYCSPLYRLFLCAPGTSCAETEQIHQEDILLIHPASITEREKELGLPPVRLEKNACLSSLLIQCSPR